MMNASFNAKQIGYIDRHIARLREKRDELDQELAVFLTVQYEARRRKDADAAKAAEDAEAAKEFKVAANRGGQK